MRRTFQRMNWATIHKSSAFRQSPFLFIFLATSVSKSLLGIMPIYPTNIIVASYGRLGGDLAIKDVEEYLKVFREYCPYLPEVHFLDDPTTQQIEKEKHRYPSGAFVILNAHGKMKDGKFEVGSRLSSQGFQNAEPIINSLTELGWGAKLWVGTCASGGACFKEDRCVGAECSEKEVASAHLPVLKRLDSF